MGEDGMHYEGELGSCGSFNGKGTLYFPNGDFIEGSFSGTWPGDVKINGTLQRGCALSPCQNSVMPKTFGKFSVTADDKWEGIFKQLEEHLSIHDKKNTPVSKIWEALARYLDKEKQSMMKHKKVTESLDGLDKIPSFDEELTYTNFQQIQTYLSHVSYFIILFNLFLVIIIGSFNNSVMHEDIKVVSN